MLFPLYDHNPHHRFPLLTVLIIVVNVVVMGWLTGAGPRETLDIVYHYGFVPKRVSDVGDAKPVVVRVPQVDHWGQPVAQAPKQVMQLSTDPPQVYLTFLTTMFLHGSWLHLVANMWMLWVFGNNIEERLGHVMYLFYYLLGGLAGTVCHFAIDPMSDQAVIGASGAVAAVLGGYAVSYPTAKVRTLLFLGIPLLLDLPALVVLGLWFALQAVAGIGMLRGVVDAPVAFWAHIGGFAAGILLVPFFTLGTSPPDVNWRQEVEELFRFDEPR